jgi:hypothetical protein
MPKENFKVRGRAPGRSLNAMLSLVRAPKIASTKTGFAQFTLNRNTKSCAIYEAGPTRKVPGRKGMSFTEDDWVDEDATAHRRPDD